MLLPAIRLPRTVVRFASVGVANTAIDLALFWMLQAQVGVLCANFVSTSAGMVFSFVLNGRHTFGATRITGQQALVFLATNGFTMWLLQPFVIGVAHGLVGAPLPAAKVVALGSSMVTNFLLYQYAVWRSNSSPRGTSGPRREGGLPFETPRPSAPQEPQPTAELAKPWPASRNRVTVPGAVTPGSRQLDRRARPTPVSPSRQPAGPVVAPGAARR